MILRRFFGLERQVQDVLNSNDIFQLSRNVTMLMEKIEEDSSGSIQRTKLKDAGPWAELDLFRLKKKSNNDMLQMELFGSGMGEAVVESLIDHSEQNACAGYTCAALIRSRLAYLCWDGVRTFYFSRNAVLNTSVSGKQIWPVQKLPSRVRPLHTSVDRAMVARERVPRDDRD